MYKAHENVAKSLNNDSRLLLHILINLIPCLPMCGKELAGVIKELLSLLTLVALLLNNFGGIILVLD